MQQLKPGILTHHEDPHNTCPPHTWTNCLAATFNVRQGPNYARTSRKAPSGESLFEVFAVDAYTTEKKVPHFGDHVALPPRGEKGTAPRLPVPELLIINLMIPSYAPSLVWSGPGDGDGWCLVFYARLRPSAREQLLSSSPPNALKLYRSYITASLDSPLRKRTKCIARVTNPDECGFNAATASLIKKYNAKPFLVRTTSSFYLCEDYFEIDVDVHNFGRPARIGLYGCREVLSRMIFDFAVVIEGVDDDELPEQILTAVRFSHLDLAAIPLFSESLPRRPRRKRKSGGDSLAGSVSSVKSTLRGGPPPSCVGEGSDVSSSRESSSDDERAPSVARSQTSQGPRTVPSESQTPPPFPLLGVPSRPPRYQDEPVSPLPRLPLGDSTPTGGQPIVTIEGDPVEGGILMVNADMDRFPNVTIRWFRDRVPLDAGVELNSLVYIPTAADVGKRLGVALPPVDLPEDQLVPWWESDLVTPAPAQAHHVALRGVAVGSTAWLEYDYYGWYEGRSRCQWLRSRTGRAWERVPEAEDLNHCLVGPDDLGFHLKCTLTPVRMDSAKGSSVEAVQPVGLPETLRQRLVEALVCGHQTYDVTLVEPGPAQPAQLCFNHRYIWVTTGHSHEGDKRKPVSGKLRSSTRITGSGSTDTVVLQLKEGMVRLRVPAVETRLMLVLVFRLYHALALEDLAPECVGPDVHHDWRKGKFEAFFLEQRKPSVAVRAKPNCHHRLRLALARS
eukprot:RCo008027